METDEGANYEQLYELEKEMIEIREILSEYDKLLKVNNKSRKITDNYNYLAIDQQSEN